MKSNENEMKSGMRIVLLLMQLRNEICQARLEHTRNGARIQELYDQRTDLAHDIENFRSDNQFEASVARMRFGEKYAQVSWEMREMINDNKVLEAVTDNIGFEREIERLIEWMTGQMQYPEHAVYHRRCENEGGRTGAGEC